MAAHREVVAYGDHPDQWGELFLPEHPDPRVVGIAVIIHGGYWRKTYTAELGVPAALDLSERGVIAWNLEYRRAGHNGVEGSGGWPSTFEDIASGIDALAAIATEKGLERRRVAALGHSAGGHLAVWAAGRGKLPHGVPGADPQVALTAVVSQAGVLDLEGAWRLGLSSGAVENLMGAPPAQMNAYAFANPVACLPIGVPIHAFHSRSDDEAPFSLSETYVTAAQAAGDPALLHETTGDHLDIITPGKESYEECRKVLLEVLTETN
ncbi:alpha/beta hydrolase family protein [Arthrobacter celericrescens]|uniref:alpha/beta hydrolase family protein n=1 Tax=Arthrobacter celericrescens TaxID=2320851 RepID=UPI000EA19BEB|nr:alpha/beta hydrolase [Arthrobacter celericrescens]